MSRTQSEELRAFWGGPPLTAYEELSLTSVVSRGHRVMLYSYDKALRVPAGVELLSAEEILPGTIHEFVYPNGDRSIALQSDLFRYEVLRRYGGWYFRIHRQRRVAQSKVATMRHLLGVLILSLCVAAPGLAASNDFTTDRSSPLRLVEPEASKARSPNLMGVSNCQADFSWLGGPSRSRGSFCAPLSFRTAVLRDCFPA
jgi:hypothetical protein